MVIDLPSYYSDRSGGGGGGYNKGFSGGSGYGSSSGGGGGGSYGSGALMEQQHDTVFVSGLLKTVTEEQLAEHFGQIGVIKNDRRTNKPKIWMYMNKETGEPKGECTITYDDASAAKAAIEWFNGKPLAGNGPEIKVEFAQRKAWQPGGGGGGGGGGGRGRGGDRGRGGFRGGRGGDRGGDRGFRGDRGDRDGGGAPRDGDWQCNNDGCKNSNFAWRHQCNLCGASRPDGMGGDGGRGRGRGGDRGRGGFGGRGRGPPRGRGGDRGRGGPPRDRMDGDRRDRRPKPY